MEKRTYRRKSQLKVLFPLVPSLPLNYFKCFTLGKVPLFNLLCSTSICLFYMVSLITTDSKFVSRQIMYGELGLDTRFQVLRSPHLRLERKLPLIMIA